MPTLGPPTPSARPTRPDGPADAEEGRHGPFTGRVAAFMKVRPAWVHQRVSVGRRLSESSTADAATRLGALRNQFLSEWNASIARWADRIRAIDAGSEPFGSGLTSMQMRSRALAELRASMRQLLTDGWTQAYRIGHSAKTGQAPVMLSDALLADIRRQIGFADRFAQDIAGGVPSRPGRMSVGNRSALYGNGLTGAFNRGAVDGVAEDEVIFWRLGACDHCTDCPVLAVSGPYTKDNLPTLPRNGETECRMNCCCYLEFVRRPGQSVNPLRSDVPFVDAATRPAQPPPGFRLPTDAERRTLRDLEQRVNYARRKIAETAGTRAQAGWVAKRREASRLRREFTESRKVWDPPKFDVGQVVRGADVSAGDINDLLRVRGIDGRTVSRASVAARGEALTAARGELAAVLDTLPPVQTVDDVEALLLRAGAPPELLAPAVEGAELPAADLVTVNAVGWGARSALRQHLAALETVMRESYTLEFGPVGDDWLELVLAGGSWLRGDRGEVARFVEAWTGGLSLRPALARWQL